MYLGLWYNGNFLSTNSTKREEILTTYDLTNQQLTTTVTNTQFDSNSISSNNNLQALFGIAGMGIKVGFDENLTTWSNPNTTLTVTENNLGNTTTYNAGQIVNYSEINGSMSPSIEWGMSLEAGEITIRPRVQLAFGINLNNRTLDIRNAYTTNNGVLVGSEVINRNGSNQDSLRPRALIGADFVLPNAVTLGISYQFSAFIYEKNYDISGFKGNVSGNITTYSGSTTKADSMLTTVTTNTANLTVTDNSSMTHNINPRLTYRTSLAEDLRLGFSIFIPVTITNTSATDGYARNFSTTKTVYNDPNQSFLNTTVNTTAVGAQVVTDTSSFSIAPDLTLGAVYTLVPDRFLINAGIGITPFSFLHTKTTITRKSDKTTTTTVTLDANGKEVSRDVTLSGGTDDIDVVRDQETINDYWTSLTVRASVGFKLNFNENMAIDMALNSGSMSNSFTLSPNLNILFNFKF